MTQQLLNSDWCDKSKSNRLDTIAQFAEYKGFAYSRPKFRPYDDREMYVPSPMVKQFVYRIRSIAVRAMILLSVETGCSSGEAWILPWIDVNVVTKTVKITGNKGHKTKTYSISETS